MNLENENILVIGGGGFLGSYIVEELKKNNCANIAIFGRNPNPKFKLQEIEVIKGDLRNPQDVYKVCEHRTTIFHVAAKAGVWGKWKDYYDINVQGTKNVIAGCEKYKINKLIYTSSPSIAYSPNQNIEDINEDYPLPTDYLSYYPKSKAIAEQYILKANSPTLSTISLRPHLLWGPNDNHLLPRLIKKAKKKGLVIIGEGTQNVDLTYVGNAAFAHISALKTLMINAETASGKAYFISDDSPVVLWDWINHLLKECNLPIVTKQLSYKNAYRIGYLMEKIFTVFPFLGEPPLTRFVAGQLAFSHYFNISKAKNLLKYKPVYNNKDALKQTVEWLKKEKVCEVRKV